MELSVVERKVYGALIMKVNDEGYVKIKGKAIAEAIGYKAYGGIITYALQTLQYKNHIRQIGKNEYMVYV
ncbi:MAG: hypothetical protein ACI4BI_06120 [Anaerotardibacter sp.]